MHKMGDALKEARSQIIDKKYGSQMTYEGYTNRIQYGMALCDKKERIVRMGL